MTFSKQNAHSAPIFANIQRLKTYDIRQLELHYLYTIVKIKLAPTLLCKMLSNAWL